MNNIQQFIINHWPLLGALFALLALLIIEETKKTIHGVKKISANQVIELINHQNAIIIDTREQSKFNDGHIFGSLNLQVSEIAANIRSLSGYKNRPIIVVDSYGQTSIKAGIILKKNNLSSVFSLDGGITNWIKSGLPLVKKQ